MPWTRVLSCRDEAQTAQDGWLDAAPHFHSTWAFGPHLSHSGHHEVDQPIRLPPDCKQAANGFSFFGLDISKRTGWYRIIGGLGSASERVSSSSSRYHLSIAVVLYRCIGRSIATWGERRLWLLWIFFSRQAGTMGFVRNSLLLGLSLLVYLASIESWNPWPVPPVLLVVSLAIAKRLTRSQQTSNQNRTGQSSALSSRLSRRDFLRRLSWVSVGVLGVSLLDRLGAKSVQADSPCPCTQTYSHWEPWCYTSGCSFPNRRHHIWTRSCEPCYCGCGSSCRSAWCCCTCTCESCAFQCDTITPDCGCPCTWCNPCVCSDGGG